MKGLNWSKRELILGGCAAAFLLLLLVSYVHPFSGEGDARSLSWSELPEKTSEPAEPAEEVDESPEKQPKFVVVDLKGAVKSPGVYRMKEGTRVIDVIEKAGGLLKKADRKRINLAKLVRDEMVVYVPGIGEKGTHLRAPISLTDSEETNEKIGINSANTSELDELPGVGPATAEAIIAYRKKHGPFKKIEDLLKVSGIGDSTLQKMKGRISLR
ncbi:MAG TPA: ComEA family DNA-binding protein [Bacillales bacterium]